ncbi:hypothetical protein [Candidatus Magnetomonas plexicatena]|uniref:hypothetical protein n=1 Tax=Candidatus Magnetomonas plexicatena TaxID=2552947 RepID=UPI0011040653|nr:hypothetical protein E2O03_014675 [Nitrospirales bacterium LBB_01]
MELDVTIGSKSLGVDIENPYKFDARTATEKIVHFGRENGVDISELKIDSLIAKMIKGVAGCEHGCPSDAKGLVSRGFGDFKLDYIDGGILSAVHELNDGKSVTLKLFPGF